MNITENQIQEINDRNAIHELIDKYAFCADARDAAGQMSLFTQNTRFIVYMDSKSPIPAQEILGRKNLAPVFEALNAYDTTMHFNGQRSIKINGSNATGLTYCMAHHLNIEGSKQKFMIAAIRYIDTFEKQEGSWYFSERQLLVDWIENKLNG